MTRYPAEINKPPRIAGRSDTLELLADIEEEKEQADCRRRGMSARLGRRDGVGITKEIIWDENGFTLDGIDYERDSLSGRCYYLSTRRRVARYRIGAKRFAELQKECEARVMEAEREIN